MSTNLRYVKKSELNRTMQEIADIFNVVTDGKVLIGANANPKRTDVIYDQQSNPITIDTPMPFFLSHGQ